MRNVVVVALYMAVLGAFVAQPLVAQQPATQQPATQQLATQQYAAQQYAAQQPTASQEAAVPDSLSEAQITRVAQRVMDTWRIPAVALTVVKGGQTIYAKGLGALTIKEGAPQADAYTLFVNASTTKAFTAALLAMMVDKGYVQWTDPVVSHLPDFQLYDPWVTQNYLVQDIMNHKVGFQAQALDQMPAFGYSRDELYRMMRLIKPTYSFRTTYAYCNAAFTTAALLVEKYTGKTWEQALQDYIFTPLEMDHTRTGKDSYFTADNFAYGYTLYKSEDGLKRSPRNDRQETYDWLQAVSPAAFVMSNAHDMGQWMRMLLAKGTYKGQRLISEKNLEYLFTPQTICSFNDKRVVLYAQGWRIEQGEQGKLINHTGLAGGYTALVVLVPELDMGVSVLMNQGSTTYPHYAVARTLIDLCRGVERDWVAELYDEYMHPSGGSSTRKKQEAPASALANTAYAGSYFKEIFGPVKVYQKDGVLRIAIKDIDSALKHLNGNRFGFSARSESMEITFHINPATEQADAFSIDFGDDLGPFVRMQE